MNATGLFNGLFGKLESGKCRLSMNGGIAVYTPSGYKTYNVKTGRLTNCSNFVFDIGEDFFFVIPTTKVAVGDIILVGGKPKCVTEVGKNKITVINYEDSTIETIVPERHAFMGSTYFYGKIMSLFGTNFMSGKKGMDKMMSYMMMREMMKGVNGSGSSDMSSLLPFMMLGNGSMSNMFEGMFDFGADENDDEEEDDIEEEDDYTPVPKVRTPKNYRLKKCKSSAEYEEDVE